MEGILETAVQKGARAITREWQAIAPSMMLMGGAARARGFRLQGYGVFFDVEVPALRQSMFWSMSVLNLNRDNAGISGMLQSLRELARTVADPAARRQIEQEVKRIELQMGPAAKPSGPGAPVVVAPQTVDTPKSAAGGMPAAGSVDPRREVDARDPSDAYTTEVQNALIDAILEYSNTLSLGPDEWLTVAARDNEDRRLGTFDPYELVTIQIRIKGSDLLALRTGKITREEARKRVEIHEF
jgi:hypothetical protein